jgi:hypothetical protein
MRPSHQHVVLIGPRAARSSIVESYNGSAGMRELEVDRVQHGCNLACLSTDDVLHWRER